jgi:hypothetical protein
MRSKAGMAKKGRQPGEFDRYSIAEVGPEHNKTPLPVRKRGWLRVRKSGV